MKSIFELSPRDRQEYLCKITAIQTVLVPLIAAADAMPDIDDEAPDADRLYWECDVKNSIANLLAPKLLMICANLIRVVYCEDENGKQDAWSYEWVDALEPERAVRIGLSMSRGIESIRQNEPAEKYEETVESMLRMILTQNVLSCRPHNVVLPKSEI